jgi:hypothetical protein
MNSATPAPDQVSPSVTRHPLEHGDRPAPDVLPAGCCCCCCCCLHTLGGLGGAIFGSSAHIDTRPARSLDPDCPFPYRRDVFEEDLPLIPPTLLYWSMVTLSVMATCILTYLWTGVNSPGALFAGLFFAVMFLPGLQLVASLLSVLIVALFYPERSYSLRRVGKITLWSFAGAILGMLLMGGCLGVVYVASKL